MRFLKTDKSSVSIWVGVASSEERLREYVEDDYSDDEDEPSNEFCTDFGIDGIDEDFREVSTRESTTSLAELLGEHSFAENLLPLAQEANGGDQLEEPANAVILLYGYIMPDERGTRGTCSDPAMKFLGVVGPTGSDFGPDEDD